MSKCKPTQDQSKIFQLDILSCTDDGEVEVRTIEPVGSGKASTAITAQESNDAKSA